MVDIYGIGTGNYAVADKHIPDSHHHQSRVAHVRDGYRQPTNQNISQQIISQKSRRITMIYPLKHHVSL